MEIKCPSRNRLVNVVSHNRAEGRREPAQILQPRRGFLLHYGQILWRSRVRIGFLVSNLATETSATPGLKPPPPPRLKTAPAATHRV